MVSSAIWEVPSCHMTEMTERTIRRWCASGAIPAVPCPGGRGYRVPVSALGERRLLDDHLHDVPTPVYDLLTAVGAHAPQPLTVILERDGEYPPMESLLAQLDQARAALAAGRARHRQMEAA